ncbi:COP23 domain-containing protein [Symplocastrum sp. BBK-W-15]|uniref:COP23 domain-containing protein n=2 Tax=Limnofasciculus TaxID=3064905 RepID=A0AAE3GR01_9CYAN|nr:COP23 domain-containing protein [Limnofasciculus baicalensis]MCP2729115.1 COP23 domain-containing protein [Limnofasciculus baicalensis BBK-W-15]
MTQQQFVPIKTFSLSASIAIVLFCHPAFALKKATSPTTAQGQDSANTTLAQKQDDRANSSEEPRFTCQFIDGDYTVMYNPESQPGQAYAWATPSEMGGGWTPERRCNEISRRLEFYRPDGLVEMQTARENNYNIICVTTEEESDCRIVLTVPDGEDPTELRDRVFENLTVADSGQSTDPIPTFVNGDRNSDLINQVLNEGLSALGIGKNQNSHSDGIDLRPFLDAADGGTATQLNNSHPIRTHHRLNPDRFR